MSIRSTFAAAAAKQGLPVEHDFEIQQITPSTNPAWLRDFAVGEDIAPFAGQSDDDKIESLLRRTAQAGCRIFGLFDRKNPGPMYASLQTQEEDGVPGKLDKILAGEGFPQAGFGDTMVFFSIQRWRDVPKVSVADMLLDGVVAEVIENQPNIQREVTLSPIYGLRKKLQQFVAEEEPRRDLRFHMDVASLKFVLEEGLKDRESFEQMIAENPPIAHDIKLLALDHILTPKEGKRGLVASCRAFDYHSQRGACAYDIHLLSSSTPFANEQSFGTAANHFYPRDPEVRQRNIALHAEGIFARTERLQRMLGQAHYPSAKGALVPA